ncbi:MAG: MmcQ/YjbR family DNA-binding protein [Chloroflexota bacterium]
MNHDILHRLRTICLALPETIEQNEGSVGKPVFKVRNKIFAMQHLMEDRPSLWCKSTLSFQEMLVSSEPERYFVPPYVGHHGWIGIWLDVDLDWGFIGHLVEESYRKTAPKKLSAGIGQNKRQATG